VTVLIADDDAAVRLALTDLVSDEFGLKLVAAATDADEAITFASEHRPTVALLDVRMPGGGGVRAAREIRLRSPGTRVLALSAYEEKASVYEMLDAGASGYVVKGSSGKELVEAIFRTSRGQLSMSADLATACFQELLRDVTERKQTEVILRKSEEKFRCLLESAPDAMVVADGDGLIEAVNTQVERLFRYKRGEMVGLPIETLLPRRFRALHIAHRKAYMRVPQAQPMGVGPEHVGRRKDGSEFPVDISWSLFETEQGRLVVAAIYDSTDRRRAAEADRKRAEKELEASFELVRKTGRERQEFLAHLVRAQEAERLRIASDIHDDSIQAMTAAGLRLQRLRKRLTASTELEALDKVEEAIQGSISRLRRLMFDLRPLALDRAGLAAALRAQLERIQSEAGLQFEVENRLTTEPPSETRVFLYRIAMEALINVRKHAKAHRVRVRLEDLNRGWHVRIDDDGVGFLPGNGASTPGHLGLTGMRERAQMAGGWCNVESRLGSGTTVTFWLPAVQQATAIVPTENR
jgi:PAS domain S-box-containing protein